ncbi:MAG: polysaccharide deacetylase family protein [Nannocystaceae bacterium]
MSSTTGHTTVSVDLDDVACYHAIHGLPPPTDAQRALVLQRCLPRFLELFAEHKVKATFFVVGRDLARELATAGAGTGLLRRALAEGHELANHSFDHDYDMQSWSSADIYRDLAKCDKLLRHIGAHPQGFRAPGYLHHERMLAQVAALGYRYDSSSLPSPTYYLAKRSMLAWMEHRGRKSSSPRGGWRSFFGSAWPRFLPELGLWEFPIGVSGILRLPMVGTALLAAPKRLSAALRHRALVQPVLHLQLHGIDLADPGLGGDGYDPTLLERQPELRVSLDHRRDALAELFSHRGGGLNIAAVLGTNG